MDRDDDNMTPELPPLLLRVWPDTGKLTKLPRCRCYELAASGEWPVVKIGRSIRVPYAGILDWIKRKQAEAQGGC